MNSSGKVQVSPMRENSIPTILRRGFAHPLAQRGSGSGYRGVSELPEITGRACSWDAIDEDDPIESR